ncbi:ABC transporter ATP-binding protein [Mesorhizobium sp. M0276]|uniref:ABC transporter ATP-binding protein n=1 Tax=Mesorhizobium sp. M0276 TaxID=2956928 RepID=UPI003339A878
MISQEVGNSAVSVQGVTKLFGTFTALSRISLDVAPGRFVSLLGPSGCGKTTLMRIIAGLDRQSTGRVVIAGKDLSLTPPHRRPVGLVFQRYALFPHMTVSQNVGFALSLQRVENNKAANRIGELLEIVRLSAFADRPIDQLSGGQAQRVALARALAAGPPVLLLDEPMSALDLKLRQAMQLELRQLQRSIGATFLFVTHDQDEAMVMSDEIVLMNSGTIVQRGSPEEVYSRPKTLFSAKFLGEANIFTGSLRREGNKSLLQSADVNIRFDAHDDRDTGAGLVCVRPESIKIEVAPNVSSVASEPNSLTGQVREAIFQGAFRRYLVQVGEQSIMVQQPVLPGGGGAFSQGDRVLLSWPDNSVAQIEDDTNG